MTARLPGGGPVDERDRPTTVLVITRFFPPENGGSAHLMHNLALHWPGRDVEVLTSGRPDAAEFDDAQPYKIHRRDLGQMMSWRWLRPRWPLFYARMSLEISRFLAEHRGRYAAVLTDSLLPGALVPMVAKRLGLPYFLLIYGEELTGGSLRGWERSLTTRILEEARLVFTISRFTRDLIVLKGIPAEKTRIVYPGVDPEVFEVSEEAGLRARMRFGLGDRPMILSVGSLLERKGVDMVVEGMPALLRRFPDLVYLIVGKGMHAGFSFGYEEKLKARVRTLGLGDQVRFLGEVPREDLLALYKAADVFVMPNRLVHRGSGIEGFGIVFLEAAAAGVAVVAGRSGGAPDAVVHGRTGFLVDPYGPGETALRLIDLLSDPQRARRMGEAGCRRAHSFLWERKAPRYGEEILKSLGLPCPSRTGL